MKGFIARALSRAFILTDDIGTLPVFDPWYAWADFWLWWSDHLEGLYDSLVEPE